jgi:hypothetical protein
MQASYSLRSRDASNFDDYLLALSFLLLVGTLVVL